MKIFLKLFILFSFFCPFTFLKAQVNYSDLARPENDILHYKFELEINDDNNILKGTTSVEIKFLKAGQNKFSLDLIQKKLNEMGMKVFEVSSKENQLTFIHENDKIEITSGEEFDTSKIYHFVIKYEGIPGDGLIISKNKFGDRTFFGDNWPNRARNWLVVEDHLSDKATVEFVVIAPEHYKVVANGKLISELPAEGKKKITTWRENIPIPTKVMVFGAADFTIESVGKIDSIEVQSWAYTKDNAKIFSLYHHADKILTFFQKNIGPYCYEKLANVQSKTQFGGMENASCIFYNESADEEGNSGLDILLSHEIAHQWFGNSVSEKNWQHIWLSEGFATYFSALYMQHAYGDEEFNKEMQNKKQDIFDFQAQAPGKIIIDSTETNLMDLLNTNSYQKGSWVLHMLRYELGDKLFWKCIKAYYLKYRNKNADTNDFISIIEKISERKWSKFFNQWLYSPGIPVISYTYKYNIKTQKLHLTVKQEQDGSPFHFHLDALLKNNFETGEKTEKIFIDKKINEFTFNLSHPPSEIRLDPNQNLLIKIKIKSSN